MMAILRVQELAACPIQSIRARTSKFAQLFIHLIDLMLSSGRYIWPHHDLINVCYLLNFRLLNIRRTILAQTQQFMVCVMFSTGKLDMSPNLFGQFG